MVFGLFSTKPVLDEASAAWIVDVFDWGLRHFGADVFHGETRLVLPSDEFFPGRVDSVAGMARLVFERVQGYAGLAHWPARLVAPEAFDPEAPQRLALNGPLRLRGAQPPAQVVAEEALTFSYDPRMVNDPEVLIGAFAHGFAHYLAALAPEPPPGGRENWPHATEVLGVLLGFGVMLANSAFHVRAGCGSCHGPAVDRPSYLSQYDLTWALALFCTLKGVPAREVVRHLKPSLRPTLKKALKEVAARQADLARLRGIEGSAALPGGALQGLAQA